MTKCNIILKHVCRQLRQNICSVVLKAWQFLLQRNLLHGSLKTSFVKYLKKVIQTDLRLHICQIHVGILLLEQIAHPVFTYAFILVTLQISESCTKTPYFSKVKIFVHLFFTNKRWNLWSGKSIFSLRGKIPVSGTFLNS